jgi:D-sedoheptulose 7-phosphate isomerase
MNTRLEVRERITAAKAIYSHQSTFNEEQLENLAKEMAALFASGGRVAFVGNGGSAAEAMHLAAEFTGRCVNEHRPLSALCLNESQSAITAIANDYGVEHIFSRQVEAHLRSGDILIGLSTSGKSENILNAIKSAHSLGVDTMLWMGDFDSPQIPGEIWKVPSKSTPRIQEVHLTWGHIVAEIVELLI